MKELMIIIRPEKLETVKNIMSGVRSRDNIWNVNTEKEYLEGK